MLINDLELVHQCMCGYKPQKKGTYVCFDAKGFVVSTNDCDFKRLFELKTNKVILLRSK